MSDQIIHAPGTICWNELATKNAEAAKDFYTQLFGWTAVDEAMGEITYTVFSSGGQFVAGMMPMTAEWGDVPSHWMAYVAVEDVDATARKVEELGGKICVPPSDIKVGRFSVITDPTGATISIIKLRGAHE